MDHIKKFCSENSLPVVEQIRGYLNLARYYKRKINQCLVRFNRFLDDFREVDRKYDEQTAEIAKLLDSRKKQVKRFIANEESDVGVFMCDPDDDFGDPDKSGHIDDSRGYIVEEFSEIYDNKEREIDETLKLWKRCRRWMVKVYDEILAYNSKLFDVQIELLLLQQLYDIVDHTFRLSDRDSAFMDSLVIRALAQIEIMRTANNEHADNH